MINMKKIYKLLLLEDAITKAINGISKASLSESEYPRQLVEDLRAYRHKISEEIDIPGKEITMSNIRKAR